MFRVYNFAAGPAMMPEEVLVRAQQEMWNWQDTGVSVMEIGHRTNVFQDMLTQLESKIRGLMKIPNNYKVLFLAGGGQGQFSFAPMNLTGKNKKVDYIVSGIWSERAAKYASRYADVNIVTTASLTTIAQSTEWNLSSDAAYVYYCPNETINGFQMHTVPETNGVPIVADFTSSILSIDIDVSKYGVIFASAQKNLGISGITLVIVRDDLLDQAQHCTPEVFSYKAQAEQKSLLNTIPVLPVYMMDLMIDWIINSQGGLNKVVENNLRKAEKIYTAIDESNGFYTNNIEIAYRSLVNIPFNLPSDELVKHFLIEAAQEGLAYLNGHKLVGGVRVSIYNALPEAGVDKLIIFMNAFAKKYSKQ
jgi:phosphoserine aminotransferase